MYIYIYAYMYVCIYIRIYVCIYIYAYMYVYTNIASLVYVVSPTVAQKGPNHVVERFPTFLHLRTPWQPISINCTRHISKMFVINIAAVISNLYAVTVNK